MLAFVAILWVQRDYTTPMGGIFPDRIMGIMVLLALLGLVLALTPRGAARETEKAAPSDGERRWRDLFVVIGILLVWTLFLRRFGFALLSVLGFSGMAYYLSGRYRDVRTIVTALAVGLGTTALFVFIFGYLLKVPLPPGTLFD
jgi:hypothetical protein